MTQAAGQTRSKCSDARIGCAANAVLRFNGAILRSSRVNDETPALLVAVDSASVQWRYYKYAPARHMTDRGRVRIPEMRRVKLRTSGPDQFWRWA